MKIKLMSFIIGVIAFCSISTSLNAQIFHYGFAFRDPAYFAHNYDYKVYIGVVRYDSYYIGPIQIVNANTPFYWYPGTAFSLLQYTNPSPWPQPNPEPANYCYMVIKVEKYTVGYSVLLDTKYGTSDWAPYDASDIYFDDPIKANSF
jgi:hypothetical protein